MTWHAVKQDIDRRVAETMAEGGYEARPAWTGRTGVIQCGNRGHESWNFEVRVELKVDGTADIKVHSIYDKLTRGKLRDIETDELVPQRAFAFRSGDTVGMALFVRELRKEVQNWVVKHTPPDEAVTQEDVAIALRELVEREPDTAADTLAGILQERLASSDLVAIREALEEANRVALSP